MPCPGLAWRFWILAVLLVPALIAGSGCSSRRPYPVNGQVVFEDGKPATELFRGTVMFNSDELKVSAAGPISQDGTFHLSTNKRNDGAYPGRYRVLVTAFVPDPEIPSERKLPKPGEVIDQSYASPQTSPLEATVEEKTNEITLTVKRGKRKG